MKLRLLYFASLADRAGCTGERLDSEAATPRELYGEIRTRHGFAFEPARLRVAVNGALTGWDHVLADADEIAFLPPVSGG
jgi:molybdopterin converting factor subunit 1